jgi:hypothetical protein
MCVYVYMYVCRCVSMYVCMYVCLYTCIYVCVCKYVCMYVNIHVGHVLAYFFSHCTTSQKVACSIPDGVSGIFNRYNPSGRTMALGLTQSLTQINTRNIP